MMQNKKKKIEQEKYNPDIKAHLENIKDRWGDPEENKMSLVKYGIKPLDKALWGIDTISGELNVILGPEKQRKTTFAINILINIMMADMPKEKPFVVIDTLESGMHPNRYVDTLIANLASRWLMRQEHEKYECPVCKTDFCKRLRLSPDFLRFKDRTPDQLQAIDWAIAQMKSWPLFIYGATLFQGNTRILKSSAERWRVLQGEHNAKIYFIDHVQQYSFGFGLTSDYEKQLRAVAEVGDFVAQYGTVVFLLSQVSLTSQREAREGIGRIGATGGQKAAQEANTIFATGYKDDSGIMEISVLDSRKAGRFSIVHPLDDTSGAFFGEPTRRSKVIDDE